MFYMSYDAIAQKYIHIFKSLFFNYTFENNISVKCEICRFLCYCAKMLAFILITTIFKFLKTTVSTHCLLSRNKQSYIYLFPLSLILARLLQSHNTNDFFFAIIISKSQKSGCFSVWFNDM